VTLEKLAGPVTASLEGGRFKAGAMAGRIAVTATRGADVELAGLARGADVKLSDGATAWLADVAGQIKVEANDAELRAERCGNLLLTGARSRVDVAGVDRLAQLEMTDTSLVLDLTSSRSNTSLKLLGTGRAVVRLPAPCVVRLAGPAGSEGAAVDVTGCDLHLPGRPGRPAEGRLFYGERRLVTLTVFREEGVELEVLGWP
jgi:hypothetical protein